MEFLYSSTFSPTLLNQLAAVFVASQSEKSPLAGKLSKTYKMFEQCFLMFLLYFLNFHFVAFKILMPIGVANS